MMVSYWVYHNPVDSGSMILANFPIKINSSAKNIYVQKIIYSALVVKHWNTLKWPITEERLYTIWFQLYDSGKGKTTGMVNDQLLSRVR